MQQMIREKGSIFQLPVQEILQKKRKLPLKKKNVNSEKSTTPKANKNIASKRGRGGARDGARGGGRKATVTKNVNILSPTPSTSLPSNVTEGNLPENCDHERKNATKNAVDKRDSPVQSPRHSTPNDGDGSEVTNMSDHFNDVLNVVESSQPVMDTADPTMIKCPLCDNTMNNVEEHISLYHAKRYACHLCSDVFALPEEFSTHIAEIHQYMQHSSSQSSTEESNPIRIVFKNEKMFLSTSKFNKLKSSQKLTEVEMPGNGFCFTSALLVALWEQGVEKTFESLAIEIMHEIRTHSSKYTWTKTTQVTSVSASDSAIKACEDFIQAGIFTDEYVDLCIGSTANALGINLNIIHKNKQTYNLIAHDCMRYTSVVNIFLIFHQNDAKHLDAHYNCLTSAEFYKNNKKEISELVIQRPADADAEDPRTRKDLLYAQKLSREQYEADLAARQRITRSSKSKPSKEER